MRFFEALTRPFLLGDGAMGTYLVSRGFTTQPYDLANLLAPDWVREAHAAYFAAGSHFVETNTFTANHFRFLGRPEDLYAINLAGARLAREAAGPDRLVFGAMGPAGKPMEPIGSIPRAEVVASARQQAEALAEGGVDALMLETFLDLDEIEAAVEGVRLATNLPIIVSKAYIEDGEALGGGLPIRCAERLAALDVAVIGANCVVGPQRMLDLVRMLREGCTLPLLAMPTPGLPQLVKGQVVYDTSPEYFAKGVVRLVEEGARLIGGCCGTTPAHIAAIRAALDSGVKVRARSQAANVQSERAVIPETPPTALKAKLDDGSFVVAVEMDVPRGVNLEKFFSHIATVRDAGADVINISDGARARLRMNPMAVCRQIQDRLGMETVMHFACRDRNLLAMQADLLGCYGLGIRNILAVTGDPANIGDFPSSTSVFDIDAIGLARIIARLNEGVDLAGYSVGARCGFTLGVAYNPMALDPEFERDRLLRKAESAPHMVYTQPVFDVETADRAIETCAQLGLKCLVGLMPLRSAKHAEFMHNEVPGITVPDRLRKLLAEAGSDAEGLEIGTREAEMVGRHIRAHADGLYLMPPANKPEVTARLIAAGRESS